MHAMVLKRPGDPLEWTELPDRKPGPGEIRVAVLACGVCPTDLGVTEGTSARHELPRIPGHEIVGRVEAIGPGVRGLRMGQRVGVPWLDHAGGVCPSCVGQRAGVCATPDFTGYSRDGGFATAMLADARHAFPLGEMGSDESLAPLLCAGLIGWRSLTIAGPARRIGLYGFGAAANIVSQVASWQGRQALAFTRPGDVTTQIFARSMGVAWAGGWDEQPSPLLDAAIIFAPDGELVPLALAAIRKGGRVVCAGIHMSDIPPMAHRLLWGERQLVSAANLTRQDGIDFLRIAPEVGLVTKTRRYALADANEALDDLRAGRLQGAAVLVP
jgi:propanol-preferring alcohol dehydrogenase